MKKNIITIDEDLAQMPSFNFEKGDEETKKNIERTKKIWGDIATSILTPFTPANKSIQKHILTSTLDQTPKNSSKGCKNF